MFYRANDKYSATLSSGYTVGQTTLSVNVVPDNVPTLVCVAKGTTKETIFIVTGTTINSLTGVSRLKGYNGALDAQMPVTCLNNEEFVNQYSAAVSTPETLIQLQYGIDGGSTDAYVVSLDVPPTAYVAGQMITFKANTANTGACTLNVNSLGAKSIYKNTNEELSNNDIKAGEVVTVIYDGTAFQFQTGVPSTFTPSSTDTLTNKTNIARNATYTPAGAGTTTLDLSTGGIHTVTMPAATQTLAISNATVGQCFMVEINNVTSQGALTWFSGYTIRWAGGTAPTLTGTNGKKDTFGFRITGANTADGYVVGQNL